VTSTTFWNFAFASSVDTPGDTMTRSPGRQSAGVAMVSRSVAWSASTTRTISSKLRPTYFGYVGDSRNLLSGSMIKTDRGEIRRVAEEDGRRSRFPVVERDHGAEVISRFRFV
jgi:hypothetical protein